MSNLDILKEAFIDEVSSDKDVCAYFFKRINEPEMKCFRLSSIKGVILCDYNWSFDGGEVWLSFDETPIEFLELKDFIEDVVMLYMM